MKPLWSRSSCQLYKKRLLLLLYPNQFFSVVSHRTKLLHHARAIGINPRGFL
ncbi:hypothetical protein HanIR_Chr10g0456441 [Helianthus annuus]|nr:hypothetical protein HanIR_Chr10g0456441 [Helianthus annuus]